MLNMKYVKFTKGGQSIGVIVTPTGCKPVSLSSAIICTKWGTGYVCGMSGSQRLSAFSRTYEGWNKTVTII